MWLLTGCAATTTTAAPTTASAATADSSSTNTVTSVTSTATTWYSSTRAATTTECFNIIATAAGGTTWNGGGEPVRGSGDKCCCHLPTSATTISSAASTPHPTRCVNISYLSLHLETFVLIENVNLLGFYAVSLGNYCLMFWRFIMPSSSGLTSPRRGFDFLALELTAPWFWKMLRTLYPVPM